MQLAGLCHDLGHGPFSHLFDHNFLPSVGKSGQYCDHEERSVRLLENMIDQCHLDFEREDIEVTSSLIRGRKEAAKTNDQKFLFDIVANSTSGIDTDKLDYLARDVYNLGMENIYGFDHQRLMSFAKVVGENICFHQKEYFNIQNLFLTRYQLHRTYFSSKVLFNHNFCYN